MTLQEFRAWLDGFQETIDCAPTEEQWVMILGKLNDVRTPEPEIRYVEGARRYERARWGQGV